MSKTPKTDAILVPLLLMLQSATSNEDCKTATINVVRHAITHAKAMEMEATRLRQAISDTLEENAHLTDGDDCTLKKLVDALLPNAPDHALAASRVEPVVGKLMSFEETLKIIEYIGTPDQPKHEHGGFHPTTILCAQSALFYLRQLSANAAPHPEPR